MRKAAIIAKFTTEIEKNQLHYEILQSVCLQTKKKRPECGTIRSMINTIIPIIVNQ